MTYESDLIEAIYEVIANTEFKVDGEDYLKAIRRGRTDFELDKDNARINIVDNDSGITLTITATKTHASKPPKKQTIMSENGFDVKYLAGGIWVITKDDSNHDDLLNDFMEAIGGDDIVSCNEINTHNDYMVIDSLLHIYRFGNLNSLEESGRIELGKCGTLKDEINLEMESHRDFLMWYFHTDTIEEAVHNMNEFYAIS